MLRRIFTLTASILVIAGIAGCRQIIVSEVMQQPLGKKLYLKQNIWYEKPRKISCLNIQKGKILTFGTEVEAVDATDYQLTFKTPKDGKEYTIDYYHSLIMLPMEGYIKQIFTLKTRDEMTKGMKPSDVKMMLSGRIRRGMTKKQVILACGRPAACRTPSTLNSTWIYWLDEDSVYRVIFRKDKINLFVSIDKTSKYQMRNKMPEKSKKLKKSKKSKK